MKYLIYFVSFGSLYENHTAQAIWSLLNVGKYKGDIAVIGDRDKLRDDFNINDKVKFINVNSLMKETYNITEKSQICNFQNTKPFIYKVIDINQYDYILYLDSDVLINSDKINEILDFYSSKEKIAIQSDRSTIGGKRGINCGFNLFTDDEIQKFKNIGLCSGVVGVPKKYYGLFKIWEEKLIKDHTITSDQGALHWVIAHNFLNDFEYIKDTRVYRSDLISKTTVLHFFRKRLYLMDSYFTKHLFKK